MADRQRRNRRIGDSTLGYDNRIGHADVEFVNPYPWMSDTEARVYIYLENRSVPFTWRFFDGALAPHIQAMMPDYAPEFTLKEYKTIIVVQGSYFSSLPGVLDRTALAQALFEYDHWKVVVLFESDVLRDLGGTLERSLPWLRNPPIKGKPRNPPLGVPDFMAERRKALSAFNLRRGYYALDRQKEETSGRTGTTGRRRRRPRREHARRARNREGR